MAGSRSVEDRLADLAAIPRGNAGSREALSLLTRSLAAKTGMVVARAARVAQEARLVELLPELLGAFERLRLAPFRADPGCRAKTAIAEALVEIGEVRPANEIPSLVLLPGARHVQWEPVRGGRIDTAGDLKASCAAGLVKWNHPEALRVLADHLADPLVGVREVAARILGWRAVADAVPLLRLRIGIGDDPRVLAECFRAYFALDPEGALPLAAQRLDHEDEEVFRIAALSVGESRSKTALNVLTTAWEGAIENERRAVLAAALVLLRRDDAVEFLLDRVREETTPTVCAVLEALATGRGDDGLVLRVTEAVSERHEEPIRRTFERSFL